MHRHSTEPPAFRRDDNLAALPGDELLGRVDRQRTRGIDIAATHDRIWPWIAQMGQGRGGLYSYDRLENLVGCDIHSADHLVDAWQSVSVGDQFRLHPDMALRVAVVEPGRVLVVRGGVPMGPAAPPYDFTWAFILDELDDDTTRLLVRERYAFTTRWASLIVDPVSVVSSVMTRRMLRGIRSRVEAQPHPDTATTSISEPSALDGLAPGVHIVWLPLGAGAHVVRLSGRVYEAIAARLGHRSPVDLYHSALVAVTDDARFVVEMTPIPRRDTHDRGVVGEGAVGTRLARPFRVFRYEVHRWRNGPIGDLAAAVESPVRLSHDPAVVQILLDLVPEVPTPVWGRDELETGEMWNSNSVCSWLLTRSGIDLDDVRPPSNGRAPGWDAGRTVARRSTAAAGPSGSFASGSDALCATW